MLQLVLIGGQFQILDTEHDGDMHFAKCTLGSVFEMSEEMGRQAVLHGAALLPKDRFEAIGFTEPEIKAYPNARVQAGAPASFHAKLLAARIALHEYRAELAQEAV